MNRHARRGSAYVMVLAISLLVTVIGVAALTAVRVQMRTSSNTSDAEDARVIAQSGLEWARVMINNDANWRSNRTSGAAASVSFGGTGGSFTITATDPVDNDLSNSPLDPVVLDVVGYKGDARQSIQVTLTPAITAYTCLEAAIFSAATFSASGGTTSGGMIASNGNIVLSGNSKMDANCEAAGTFGGTAYFASRTSGVAARKQPDSSVFDYYIRNGTAIAYASTGGNVDKVLLSPASNPYGATNANGIYYVDCGGNKIVVKNSRIVGTLVLLNVKPDSTIDNMVSFEPYVSNYPVLMVKGSITFQYDVGSLSESTVARNFNPPGSPYKGAANLTMTDTYPSGIYGLAYVSGNLSAKQDITLIAPLVVGGTAATDHDITTTYESAYLKNPPPGFFDPPPMKASASSWAQTVN